MFKMGSSWLGFLNPQTNCHKTMGNSIKFLGDGLTTIPQTPKVSEATNGSADLKDGALAPSGGTGASAPDWVVELKTVDGKIDDGKEFLCYKGEVDDLVCKLTQDLMNNPGRVLVVRPQLLQSPKLVNDDPYVFALYNVQQDIKPILKLCKQDSKDPARFETIDWKDIKSQPESCLWEKVFANENWVLKHLKPAVLNGSTLQDYEIFEKTPVQRWPFSLKRSTGDCVIYSMVIFDPFKKLWMGYTGQAKTLGDRFHVPKKGKLANKVSSSHLAAIHDILNKRHQPWTILESSYLFVDLVAATSMAVTDKPVYLFVVEAVPPPKLDARETAMIKQLDTINPDIGYNKKVKKTSQ